MNLGNNRAQAIRQVQWLADMHGRELGMIKTGAGWSLATAKSTGKVIKVIPRQPRLRNTTRT